MRIKFTVFLLFPFFAGNSFAQSALNEFVVEPDDDNQIRRTFFKECKDNDGNIAGTIVFSTTIPDLKFRMPDNQRRLISISEFKDNRYVICVKPTDKKDAIGGIFQYSIEIGGSNFKTLTAFRVKDIVAGVPQYFKINPKESEQAKLGRERREAAERQAEQERRLREAAERKAAEERRQREIAERRARDAQGYDDDSKKIHFGALAGLSLANQNSDSWIYEDANNAKVGFYAGLLFEYKFNPYFSFQPELLFVQKGATGKAYRSDVYIYTTTGEYIPDVLVNATVQLNYLELPLNFIINIPTSRNSAIFFGGGYTLAYGLSGKLTLNPSKDDLVFYLSDEEKEADVFKDGDEQLFNRFDAGYNLLAGFRINRFFVRAGYEWSEDNIAANTDEGYYSFKNTCFNLSLGVKF